MSADCKLCGDTRYIEVPANPKWEEHGTIYAECPRCNNPGRSRRVEPEQLNDGEIGRLQLAVYYAVLAAADSGLETWTINREVEIALAESKAKRS